MKNQFPSVPVVLPPKDRIPEGYRLMVYKWSYPANRLGETVEIQGEPLKKMLTLDINIPDPGFASLVNSAPLGQAAAVFRKNYKCVHRCANCFNEAELHNPVVTTAEVMKVVGQQKELGGESVKFLGPGELLMNSDLFRILDFLAERDMVVGIFTKAALLGSDELARKYQGMNSEELVRRLVAYSNTTFLVGARSFDPDLENSLIPQNKREHKDPFNYWMARNIAIERLCAAGMNANLFLQRMALIDSPVTPENLEGAFEIYRWGIERNIPVYIPPTMVSGKGHKLVKSASELKFENDYIDLAVKVYTWAIERGAMTIDQLKEEGAHPYIGVTPCNQLTHGLYVHYDGQVWRCPGNDTPDFVVHQNVREQPLKEIWMNSRNYRVNAFNNHCVKDGISLPQRFYTEVMKRVIGQ
ncbi:MAG: radical SAM protein [Candidatus Taylorbacteria bacterium]|nr:radical SAM protein [Candidatus Taylorbacteria bacterium]